MTTRIRGLAELRRLFGLVPGYEAMDGTRCRADREASLRVLAALGAHLGDDGEDIASALRARQAELDARGIEPVTVAWNGALRSLRIRLPDNATATVVLHARLESGEVSSTRVEARPVRPRPRRGWTPTHRVQLPHRLPLGYHVLAVETGSETFETFVIAAPRHAWSSDARAWGTFLPLYAVWSDRSWGIGDYSELERAARWCGALGADFVATLPLLATFLDAPFDPSPYSPASRLFWSDVFIDVTAAPGWTPALSPQLEDEITACRTGDLVDYRRIAALKRRELDRARRAAGDSLTEPLRRFTASRSRALDYARFRAVCDRRRETWHAWPDRLRAGELRDGDFAPEDVDYHIYAQWLADLQLGRVAAARHDGAAALYLDMPLGVNPDSYDTWRFRPLFAEGVSAGAPPDPLFTGGQNWGFRPLSPEALRADRYAYFIETLRHHFRHASMLRLDHVMGLYRLFWIPADLPATRGVYVRYPEDELFAVLVLESARHQAVVIGEDLGTVPPAVRRAMTAHHVQRMHVVQFEASPDADPPVASPPEPVVASLNTHDMPTFAGFWKGSEIDDQLELHLLDAAGHAAAHRRRGLLRDGLLRMTGASDAAGVRNALLDDLARSTARYVLLNLEDLWLEDRPQNVPGTSAEKPNWKRRARLSLDECTSDDTVTRVLTRVDRLRATAATDGMKHG